MLADRIDRRDFAVPAAADRLVAAVVDRLGEVVLAWPPVCTGRSCEPRTALCSGRKPLGAGHVTQVWRWGECRGLW